MPYCQLYYHLVWGTRERQPVLTADVEATVHEALRAGAARLGASVLALDGTADHVHLVAAVPPRVSVASFVAQVKNAAVLRYHKENPEPPLQWDEEYGVFSCDRKRLPNYIEYVEGQKEHHAAGTTIAVLERTASAPQESAGEHQDDEQ